MDKMNNKKTGIQKGVNVLSFFGKTKLKPMRLGKKKLE